jgi:hypothetical protein
MKKKQSSFGFIAVTTLVVVFLSFSFFVAPTLFSTTYQNTSYVGDSGVKLEKDYSNEVADLREELAEPKINYVATPEQVKAIYMSACVAGTTNFRQDLVDLIQETELNSIVIDIKDYTGTISFDSGLAGDQGEGCRSGDMETFISELHDLGIYVIGRVTVFQDPFYADLHPELAVKKESDKSVWSDYKGIHFIEVGAREYWDYILDLTKRSHEIGFDEINFDYVRFPSDGNMKDIYFPFSNELIEENPDTGKAIALEEFFKYLYSEIEKYNEDQENPLVTSADLFGMVTTNYDDLNIGQVLERALPYFDYIAPMVYPSHYPDGFNGWADPNKVPYELIYYVMDAGAQRVETMASATTTPDWVREKLDVKNLRTWIQDFDYGGDYDIAEVRAQIQATYDVGLDSWMIWAPSNRYTRGALKEPGFVDEIAPRS